jgi:putative ABC transport system permease protein
LAILPGIALSELWQSMKIIEKVLALVAALVVASSLLGMITMILSTLKQRQREIAILRATGASARFIFALVQIETALIAIIGTALGITLLWVSLLIAQPIISEHYGIVLPSNIITAHTALYALGIIVLSILLAIIPALLAYRQSLAHGRSVRE